MSIQLGFFDLQGRFEELSAAEDPLERLGSVVDFELFRPVLHKALKRAQTPGPGQPPKDAVLMFKILVLQALYGISDEQGKARWDIYPFSKFIVGKPPVLGMKVAKGCIPRKSIGANSDPSGFWCD